MAIKTAKALAAAALDVAQNYKSLYVMGCFGAPMTAKNRKRYSKNHKYNRQPHRTAMIQNAGEDTFGFDCVTRQGSGKTRILRSGLMPSTPAAAPAGPSMTLGRTPGSSTR